MSTKSRHNGLSSDDRSQIRSAILSSREMLESEFKRQLERYGVYDDDRVPLSELGHLSLQDRETRREIDAALERELEATEDYQRAYRNYIREATKEYLNRYVGLKTIEARGLVTETLTTKAEYGNRSYLHYTVDEIAGELTNASDDGLGVALDLAFQEIGAEIRILFEDTDYTAIEPEFTVRRDVFEELGELDDDAWAADEAIGWVYQYFGEKEREEIDERIQDHNYKVQDTDIATKTQLFTPRYIVEYLVDNSLGRMWLEMYGDDTSIDEEDNCFYLTPVEESLTDREQKDPREITVLDPACGGGHFLFYAFDVLYEMYQERTDVVESQIPREILKNNLYGIDIDPGAVQLAALALYLKAKTIEPDVTIEQLNIVSADAVLINGERKEQVLDEVELDIEERLIEQIWTSFEHVREWGSLVNIKERVEELIEEEREELEQFRKQGQARFTSDGEMTTQSSFITEQEGELSWEELKDRLINGAREVANKALEQNSAVDELFANEVEKSVKLLDILLGEYSVIVANPPYLGSSKMGDTLKDFISSNYTGSRDIYASFIERGLEFAEKDGYTAMVTPENFMFLSSYETVRELILSRSQFIEGAHLSGHSFPPKDRPFTIPFVLRNCDPSNFERSRFYRMTHEQEEYDSLEKKVDGLEQVTRSLREGDNHNDVYVINQNTIRNIEKLPFTYWFGQDILRLFDYDSLGDLVNINGGVKTGDNDYFLRKWWEIPKANESQFRPHIRNGEGYKFYEPVVMYVRWERNGDNIIEYSEEHGTHYQGLSDPSIFNKEGLTYRDFSSEFTVRKLPKGFTFDDHSGAIFPQDVSKDLLLGYLNSTLIDFVANGLNPSMNFKPNDVSRLPISKFLLNNKQKIESIAESCTKSQLERFSLYEEYKEGELVIPIEDSVTETVKRCIFLEEIAEADVLVGTGLIDEIIFDSYDVSDDIKEEIFSNNGPNYANYAIVEDDLLSLDCKFSEYVPTVDIDKSRRENIVNYSGDLQTMSREQEISPYTAARIRYEHDLYESEEMQEFVARILSYYLGCIFGRWDSMNQISPVQDGILVFDEQFDNSVTKRLRECISISFSDIYEEEAKVEKILTKSLEDWFRNNFFRYFHTKKYRRYGQRIPIYWHLESSNGAFSCFLYYHEMDRDTLPKLRGQYVDAKIGVLRNRLESLEGDFENSSEDQKRELRNQIEEVQNQLDDVEDFGERLDTLINEGFEPDFEAGIWENIQKVDEYDLLQTELDKL